MCTVYRGKRMFPLVGGADKLEKVKIFMKRERYKRVYAHFRASRIGCLHSLFFFQVTFNHATHKKSKLTNLGTAKECTNISSHSRIFLFIIFVLYQDDGYNYLTIRKEYRCFHFLNNGLFLQLF